VNVACVSQKKVNNVPFEISGASYFSWVVDENEKGTTVEITLNDVGPEVRFDSLIFRKVIVPVRVSEDNDKSQTITAIFPSGKSRIPVETRHVDRPDQLIFHHNGERGTKRLKQVLRKDMVYY
jgi:hypothetical protein